MVSDRAGTGLVVLCGVIHPQQIVVLGDRFEIFSAVAAALVARIPVAHLHGGELTQGAFDDAIRHSITKMSSLHFVAAKEYRQRVIQLGEQPHRVFTVGGLGIDNIRRLRLLKREEKVDQTFVEAARVRAEIGRSKYNTGLLSFEEWEIIESDLVTREKAALASQNNRVSAEATWEQSQGRGLIAGNALSGSFSNVTAGTNSSFETPYSPVEVS